MSNLKHEDIINACRSDSSKIIEYLEDEKIEQKHKSKIDRIINIATLIIALLSLILTAITVIPM